MTPQSDVTSMEQEKEANEISGKLSISTRFRNFFLRNFLPIGTMISVIFGLFLRQPAVYLSQEIPAVKICVIALFSTIGLRIRLAEAKSAVKSYKEVILGLLLVLFVAPSVSINVLNQIPYFGLFIGDNQGLGSNHFKQFISNNANLWTGGISSCIANLLYVSIGTGCCTYHGRQSSAVEHFN